MKVTGIILFLLYGLLYPQSLKASPIKDSTVDSVFIRASIEKKYRKRNIISVSFKFTLIDSFAIVVVKEKESNKIGGITISRRINAKTDRRIEFTYFNGELVRILIMNYKLGFIPKANGGGSYYFLNGKVIYREERIIEPQELDIWVDLAHSYFEKAQKLSEISN